MTKAKRLSGAGLAVSLIRPPANLPSSTSSAPICVFEFAGWQPVCTDAIDNDCDGFIDSNDPLYSVITNARCITEVV